MSFEVKCLVSLRKAANQFIYLFINLFVLVNNSADLF